MASDPKTLGILNFPFLNRALPSPQSRRTCSSSFPLSGTTLSLHILLNNWGTGALALIISFWVTFLAKINVVSVVSHVSARFGWSMLLVLSAPPSNVDILDFTDNGVKGFLFDIRRLYNRKFRFTTSQVQTDRKTQVQPFQIPGSSSHYRSQDSWLCKKACWTWLGFVQKQGGCRTCYFNGKMENHHNLLELGYPICRQADKPIFHHLCTSALLERTQPRLGQSCLKSMASRILAAWHWLSFFKHVTYSWFWSCCFYSYV